MEKANLRNEAAKCHFRHSGWCSQFHFHRIGSTNSLRKRVIPPFLLLNLLNAKGCNSDVQQSGTFHFGAIVHKKKMKIFDKMDNFE